LAFHTSRVSPDLHGKWSTIRKLLVELRQQARILPDELTPEYDAAARPPPAATRTAAKPMAATPARDFGERDIRRMSRLARSSTIPHRDQAATPIKSSLSSTLT
jgi:hypothetical protein